MIKVYGDLISGNCYKVKLTLAQLEIEHEWIYTDLLKGACRTEAFLAKNPNGKAPLLEIETGQYLAESNAILCYLTDNSTLMPRDRFSRAQVMQWLFFEQHSHEPYIAESRFIKQFMHLTETEKAALLEQKYQAGVKALKVMDTHLKGKNFFVAKQYSIADIALYAYTHIADEGGFSLTEYTHIQKWLDHVKQQVNHIEMPKYHPSL